MRAKSTAVRLMVAILAWAFGADACNAQTSVRSWPKNVFDTAAYDLPVAAVSAVGYATAVVRSDGRLFFHGQQGQTGGGEFGLAYPPNLPPGVTYTDVSLGASIALALRSDGEVVSWGGPTAMQVLGPVPPLPAGLRYTAVSAGWTRHALAMRSDGVLLAWGDNRFGQCNLPALPAGVSVVKFHANLVSTLLLSNGQIVVAGLCQFGLCNVPALPAGVTYVDMWGSTTTMYALRSDGVLVGWGDNTLGTLNITPPPPGLTYTMAIGGGAFSMAVRSDGVLVQWGAMVGPPPTIPAGVRVVEMTAGHNYVIVLLSDGRVLWSGERDFFQIPGPTLDPGERWIDAAGGTSHALGRTSRGRVLTWGENAHGLNDVPALPAGTSYEKVRASTRTSGALRSDGELVVWGDNYYGQTVVPPLPSGLTYTDFALSLSHTVALRSDGRAVAFGTNDYGETTIPPLPSGVSYVAADVEYRRTILLRSDGELVVLGGLTSALRNVPSAPAGIDYVSVGAGDEFVALRSDGEIERWGTTAPPFAPLPFGVVYVEVAGGRTMIVARRSDGKIDVSGPDRDRVPALLAGESYYGVSASYNAITARVGPTSTYVGLAPGCSGTLPATRLVPRDTPRIGETLRVRLFDLPQNLAIMTFAWQRPTTPIPLAGAPGCLAHVTPAASYLLVGQNGQAVSEFAIPNAIGLVGLRFYNQALVFDAAANALGGVVSDAAEAVVGSW